MGHQDPLRVGSIVVLEDGMIYGWKSNATLDGPTLVPGLSSRYFLHRRPQATTKIVAATHVGADAWKQALQWRRRWARHPAAPGGSPHEESAAPSGLGVATTIGSAGDGT